MFGLFCNPTVFVIGNEYEILINTNAPGICFVKVGNDLYDTAQAGVLPSETLIHKIRVPQKALDDAKVYAVIYRPTEERKAYFSTFHPHETYVFPFRPLTKEEDIHIMHLSDVHQAFADAAQTGEYFGDDTDLFIFNGDLGEVESEEDFRTVCKFTGDVTKGQVPAIFTRGNHDIRGHLSEMYVKYFPVENGKTYFDFRVGCISGVVLDCGEDKMDDLPNYDSTENVPEEIKGINRFHTYRQKQVEFLEKTKLGGKYKLAIVHICPVMPGFAPGRPNDIEREIYGQWNARLEQMGIQYMICGHMHRAQLLNPGDPDSFQSHNYPVIFANDWQEPNRYFGGAMTMNPNKTDVIFVDKDHNTAKPMTITY